MNATHLQQNLEKTNPCPLMAMTGTKNNLKPQKGLRRYTIKKISGKALIHLECLSILYKQTNVIQFLFNSK